MGIQLCLLRLTKLLFGELKTGTLSSEGVYNIPVNKGDICNMAGLVSRSDIGRLFSLRKRAATVRLTEPPLDLEPLLKHRFCKNQSLFLETMSAFDEKKWLAS